MRFWPQRQLDTWVGRDVASGCGSNNFGSSLDPEALAIRVRHEAAAVHS